MSELLSHSQGPPPEGYSRVTNAERFRPLHRFALERLEELQSKFAVQRAEVDVPDPDIKVPLARPSIRLEPRQAGAAPIVVSFTTFPGLYVRCGRWLLEAFPSCGCDACDETLEGEEERFLELVENVVAGRFHESITIPLLRAPSHQWLLWSPKSRRAGRRQLTRKRARELVARGPRSFQWTPWPSR
jgi:Family of unknown function (DUF6226)